MLFLFFIDERIYIYIYIATFVSKKDIWAVFLTFRADKGFRTDHRVNVIVFLAAGGGQAQHCEKCHCSGFRGHFLIVLF